MKVLLLICTLMLATSCLENSIQVDKGVLNTQKAGKLYIKAGCTDC